MLRGRYELFSLKLNSNRVNFYKWHKEIAEKIAHRIGIYPMLWIAFVKGVILAVLVYEFYL
jgi:hypothetical protein